MVSPAGPAPLRERADACPGALTVHPAADGGLARVRLPGGQLSTLSLRALVQAAVELGDGSLELTSRGNVQIRGLAPGAQTALGERLATVGLLPSESHERVRNIVASPLSGLDGRACADVSALATELDHALCARPRLADLPGRFLFALDDGRGDVGALSADVTATADASGHLIVSPGGFVVAGDRVVATMLAIAEVFLDEVDRLGVTAWRIAELPDQTFLERLPLGPRIPGQPANPPPEPVGVVGEALVVLAPLGRITAEQAGLLADLADLAGPRGLRITPWRSVVLIDPTPGAAGLLARAGFGVDAVSPWYGVSSCTGQPGCAKALADVQADAKAALDRFPGRRVRWSGCARRCGRPHDTDVDVVATENGYVVSE